MFMQLFGALEAGGTKVVCAVGTGPDDLRARIEYPTTSPHETISHAIAFLKKQAILEAITAVGIASFGPVDLALASPHYGYITFTPKGGWQNVDLVGQIQRSLNLPMAFDTDVNEAALGEHRWGAGQGVDTFIYLTVGTGIGGGGMAGRRLMHGLLHPEMGHIRLPHDWQDDPFPGACPYPR